MVKLTSVLFASLLSTQILAAKPQGCHSIPDGKYIIQSWVAKNLEVEIKRQSTGWIFANNVFRVTGLEQATSSEVNYIYGVETSKGCELALARIDAKGEGQNNYGLGVLFTSEELTEPGQLLTTSNGKISTILTPVR